ncbi:MAG TPA: hypothetical protein VD970_16065, partial [Acetobacteraceae bacterium]|nr:hypothetical protein [Acetobacteraceae bacterium]
NLQENPAKAPAETLFDYLDSHSLLVDGDGYLIGYVIVGSEAEAPDQRVGSTVAVRRNRTDENPARPCPVSLTVGPFPRDTAALPVGRRVLAVRVHPRDVVAVPLAPEEPLRCCCYQVLAECRLGGAVAPVSEAAAWAIRVPVPEAILPPDTVAPPDEPAKSSPEVSRAAELSRADEGESEDEPRLGRFSRMLMRAHDAMERMAKKDGTPQPKDAPSGAGPAPNPRTTGPAWA